MLRKIRIVVALICYALLTLLFLDFTGTVHAWFGWLAKIQFWPAILALNFAVVAVLVVLTVLLGRIYCSVICPLGVFQDIISWFAGKRKRNRFSYTPAISWLRYGVLALFIIAFFAGIGSLVSLLAPYSSYGRMASNLLVPIYQLGNNLLAYFAEKMNSYAFYSTEIWIKSIPTFVIAVLTFVVIAVLAWRGGRTYCNTICPVGTVLGFISKFSLFKISIDTNKCNACGLCAKNCKASCIDSKNHAIDYSRCVACMDCVGICNHKAISYSFAAKTKKTEEPKSDVSVDESRRKFLSVTALMAVTTAVEAQQKNIDGGLATIQEKKIPNRQTPITPFGSLSANNLAKHCTACQLCVSACPNQVLRPSSDLSRLMQPEVSFERGYCRPECTKCSEVCPTGAILQITKEQRSGIQIGHAVWVQANCIAYNENVTCNSCMRHCPVGAIRMMEKVKEDGSTVKIPMVDEERCIGCGACENLCPARPFSAIYVEGHEVHRTI
ncbi:MAG: 4Fe-4S dicluster domain-containing protein [Paludibacteraceae bacterium]|nr:4Fe-4S dicluster domain-containing protein [Paludibacteraceae bacterium]